jgi:hypothetical protein
MGYFDEQLGLPAEVYSSEFSIIERDAGAWLTSRQQETPIDKERYPGWDIDLDEGVIRFGAQEHKGLLARIEALGTYDRETGTWLWAWANPKLQKLAAGVEKLAKDLEEIPEFSQATMQGSLARAWAMAAAAGYKLGSATCVQIPGDVATFVALFDLTEVEGEATPPEEGDPELAEQALADFAGPAAMHVGVLLMESLSSSKPSFEPAIQALHSISENLEQLSQSPVGRGTPAAGEALQIAATLRQATLMLSAPVLTDDVKQGIRELLALLRDIARRFGAWPEEGQTNDEDGQH